MPTTTTTDPAAEAALILRAQQGDGEAFAALVHDAQNYLAHFARKATAFGTHDVEDLVQVGTVALWEAVKTWDPTVGVRLYGHARFRVATAIWEEVAQALGTSEPTLRRVALAMRACGDDHEAARAYATAPERGTQRMTEGTFDAVQDAIRSVREGGDGFVSPSVDIAPGSEYLDRLAEVVRALDALSDKERRILSRYFGLDDRGGATDAEIATEEGLTRAGVTQSRLRALAKVRKSFHG